MKTLLSLFGTLLLLCGSASAQFTIALTEGCATFNEVRVSGKITYPASEFNICGYSVYVLDMNGKELGAVAINEKTPEGGQFSFAKAVPATIKIAFPLKIKVVTNRQTAATIDVNQYCGAVRFKNRYRQDMWINTEKGVGASQVGPGFLSAQWLLVPVPGTNFYQIQNVWRPGESLHIEKGPLECSNVPAGFWSGHWELETVVGAETFVRLKNRWKSDIYIHVENGKLEASAVPLSFQSANWLVEKKW